MASKSVGSKTTLRELMKQEKQKRIESPFAKYSNTGQLTCSLCNQSISSELFWKAHVNGREHKQKALELKSNIKQKNDDQIFVKPMVPPSPVTSQSRGVKRSHDVASSETPKSVPSSLPADFFDSNPKPIEQIEKNETSSALPEGFFDDPQRDAQVRKVEFVDKSEAEWENFMREMKQETNVSEKLEATDDRDRDFEREITETTDLITRWQKIEELHNLKDSRFKVKKQTKQDQPEKIEVDKNDDDDDEAELEKELAQMYNWRQKRS